MEYDDSMFATVCNRFLWKSPLKSIFFIHRLNIVSLLQIVQKLKIAQFCTFFQVLFKYFELWYSNITYAFYSNLLCSFTETVCIANTTGCLQSFFLFIQSKLLRLMCIVGALPFYVTRQHQHDLLSKKVFFLNKRKSHSVMNSFLFCWV